MIRLYAPDAAAGPLSVRGDQHHYLVHVHRLKAGDALELFDGRGQAFAAKVVEVTDEAVRLELSNPTQAPKVRPVHVVQGMPKGDKLELVVQKATELMATCLWPAYCERSVVRPSSSDEKKLLRWQKISDEAARQCGRSERMTVEPPRPLVSALPAGVQALVLDENEQAYSLSQVVRELPLGAALALVVGPEGGFTDAERALLTAAGARSVTLGPLVLRTETAALAALSVVRHLDGLLG